MVIDLVEAIVFCKRPIYFIRIIISSVFSLVYGFMEQFPSKSMDVEAQRGIPVDVMLVRAKGIYILMIKVNKLFPFFRCGIF